MTKQVKQLDRVIIRFAGDSGDGMQLTGDRFTQETASLRQRPVDAPRTSRRRSAPPRARSRASRRSRCTSPTTTSSRPGDSPDVLVAMNPAALKANLADIKKGATIIVDSHDFTARNLNKAAYAENPLENDSLAEYDVHALDLTDMTVEAVKEFGLSRKDASRAKNMFALGLLSWMYGRPDGADHRVPRTTVRQGARHPRRQRHGLQGGLELR